MKHIRRDSACPVNFPAIDEHTSQSEAPKRPAAGAGGGAEFQDAFGVVLGGVQVAELPHAARHLTGQGRGVKRAHPSRRFCVVAAMEGGFCAVQ
ncbi:hypothetical protein ABZ897_28370 [Nonomuraea sp. NPDC046802]|uniref:hypothetical protein n=1 Tax=Nonomuraea sp. NPDC046802 TaxID=3154919 RepID=UPI0033CB33DE